MTGWSHTRGAGRLAAAVLAVAATAGLASADSVTISPGSEGKDTSIWSGGPGTNMGSHHVLTHNFGSGYSAGLLQFDLSAISAGSTVTSATLTLYHWANAGAGETWEIYRNTSGWSENVTTWSTAPSYDPTAVASLTIPDSFTNVHRTWDVTGLVQGWVNGSYANHGMRIGDSVLPNFVYFSSSDETTASFRPALSVEFAVAPVPLPAAAWGGMALLGLIGAKRLRRKDADA